MQGKICHCTRSQAHKNVPAVLYIALAREGRGDPNSAEMAVNCAFGKLRELGKADVLLQREALAAQANDLVCHTQLALWSQAQIAIRAAPFDMRSMPPPITHAPQCTPCTPLHPSAPLEATP